MGVIDIAGGKPQARSHVRGPRARHQKQVDLTTVPAPASGPHLTAPDARWCRAPFWTPCCLRAIGDPSGARSAMTVLTAHHEAG